MSKRITASAAGALAVGLLAVMAACSSYNSGGDAPPPPESMSTVPPRGSGVFADNMVEGEATIQTLDRGTRLVTLRNDEGEVTTVKVPPEVDLDRVKTGDRVGVAYYESVAINLVNPDTPLGATGAVIQERAPADQLPGRARGGSVVVTAQVTAINLAKNTVTFRGSDGNEQTVHVRDPQLQARLVNLRVGDVLQFTYTEAIAVRILPRS